MKNRIFGFLVSLLVLFSLSGCGLLGKVSGEKNGNETEIVMGTTQNMYQVTYNYNAMQVDSMCVADYLPRNFDGWTRRAYADYETSQYVIRYMYVKELNNNNEMIYIVTPRGELYVVSKRKVVTE